MGDNNRISIVLPELVRRLSKSLLDLRGKVIALYVRFLKLAISLGWVRCTRRLSATLLKVRVRIFRAWAKTDAGFPSFQLAKFCRHPAFLRFLLFSFFYSCVQTGFTRLIDAGQSWYQRNTTRVPGVACSR